MVDSISFGFIKGTQNDIDAQQKELSQRTEQVRKSIVDFNDRFTKSIAAASKVIDSISDRKAQRELQEAVDKAKKFAQVQKRLKKEGAKITQGEAQGLVNAAEMLNTIITTNDKVTSALEAQGQKIEELNIEKPLKSASQKLGEDAREFFVTNAEAISQAGLTQDLGQAGLRALSPELAFITESLGFGLPSFSFGSKEAKEQESEFTVLNQSVANLEDTTQEVLVQVDQSADKIIQADNFREEERFEIQEDRHQETLEALDDIQDQNQGSMFSKFFGKGSFFGRVLGGLVKPLTALGGLLGKTGKAAGVLGKGGLLGLAGAVGFGIGTFINENLLSDEFKIALGDFIGPKVDSIRDFFNGVPAFFREKFNEIAEIDYASLISNSVSTLTTNIRTAVTSAFTSVSEFFSSPSKKIKEWLGIDPNIDILDSILETVLAPFKTVSDFFADPSTVAEKAKEYLTSSTSSDEPSLLDQASTTASEIFDSLGSFFGSDESQTESQLGAGISQAEVTQAVNQAAARQEMVQKTQTKETQKIIQQTTEQMSKQNSSFRGQRSLDNSPVVSDDIGLIMTLGGGL